MTTPWVVENVTSGPPATPIVNRGGPWVVALVTVEPGWGFIEAWPSPEVGDLLEFISLDENNGVTEQVSGVIAQPMAGARIRWTGSAWVQV